MKFGIRTLLVLITISGILLALWVRHANHKKRVEQHRASFSILDDRISAMDKEIEQFVLEMDTVKTELESANPVDPSMALGRSVTGESMSFGTPYFKRRYHYHWQGADGRRGPGVQFVVESKLDESGLEAHQVQCVGAQ